MPYKVVQICACTQSKSEKAKNPEQAKGYKFVCPGHTVRLAVDIDHDKFMPPEFHVRQGDKQKVIDCKYEGDTTHHWNVSYCKHAFINPLRVAAS